MSHYGITNHVRPIHTKMLASMTFLTSKASKLASIDPYWPPNACFYHKLSFDTPHAMVCLNTKSLFLTASTASKLTSTASLSLSMAPKMAYVTSWKIQSNFEAFFGLQGQENLKIILFQNRWPPKTASRGQTVGYNYKFSISITS